MGNRVDLTGKRIIITGGSMGLGLASAEACLEAGAKVFLCSRTEGPLKEATAGLQHKWQSAVRSMTADVTNREQVDEVFRGAISAFGGVDGVIHAAGVYGPIGPVIDVDPVEWFDAIRTNLFGTFLVARKACQVMKSGGGGRIVLFSGGGAAAPFPNYTAYACSKIGVVRLTETLAQEMAPFKVEINCVSPGFVITRLHQQTLAAGERAGIAFLETTKKQIASGGIPATVGAQSAAFLVSNEAKGITGKFVASPYDGWEAWPNHVEELQRLDIFTMRRIVPKDRGMDWQ
ncbi:MAG: SDR family oxidoreductase [Nitrospira sp.]|nr:MAG: SDR family oxidoreductase [Nitrospira sp.]